MKHSQRIPTLLAIGAMCFSLIATIGAAQRRAKPPRSRTSRGSPVFLDLSIKVGKSSVWLKGARISPKTNYLEIGSPEKGQDGDTLVGFQARYEASVVLSGGFLKSFYPPTPLGFVKHGGEILNRGVTSDLLTGVLLASRRSVRIERYENDACSSAWSDCLQSGPLLVLQGQPALPTRDEVHLKSTQAAIDGRYQRAFVALLPNGDAILGVTGEIGLLDLQTFLVTPPDQGGLGCTDAINLSGAGSAGLLVRASGKTMSVNTVDMFLPNAIVTH